MFRRFLISAGLVGALVMVPVATASASSSSCDLNFSNASGYAISGSCAVGPGINYIIDAKVFNEGGTPYLLSINSLINRTEVFSCTTFPCQSADGTATMSFAPVTLPYTICYFGACSGLSSVGDSFGPAVITLTAPPYSPSSDVGSISSSVSSQAGSLVVLLASSMVGLALVFWGVRYVLRRVRKS